ncbi:60S ribosomal protein L35a-3 [Glycine max]|nr:60S ribosomal protein L35a-3 [Glycine max]
MVKGRQGERVRLYVRGSILGYKRSKSNQYPSTSLIQIENVNSKEEVAWYCGKRMAYIYKAKVKKNGSHYRCIWGKVTRPHGNSGIVRAKFKSNLPPRVQGLEYSCIQAIYEKVMNNAGTSDDMSSAVLLVQPKWLCRASALCLHIKCKTFLLEPTPLSVEICSNILRIRVSWG